MFSTAAVLALAALPFLASSAFAQTCDRSYTVQAGDICDSISAANNVSTYQLAASNPSIDATCDNLYAGEVLCLGYQGEDCNTTYVVKLGDDCAAISTAYAINTTVLYENNPQIDAACDNLYVGEVLCVAGTETVVPPPSGSVVPTTIPATATPASATPTAAPAATTPAPSPSPSDDGSDDGTDDGDGDDSNLPYCDEL
ncbi:hypothetical protein BKA93DRAFT_782776 [Sparassis latifolia]